MNDEDRKPWLKKIAQEVSNELEKSQSSENSEKPKLVVVSCSALKRIYRDLLVDNIATQKLITFIFLDVPREQLLERMNKRGRVENHFMPTSLIESQLKDLEKPVYNEGCKNRKVITVDGELVLKEIDQIGTAVLETLIVVPSNAELSSEM